MELKKVVNDKTEKKQKSQILSPDVDIYENKEMFLMVADMPGVVEDDLHIHFEKNHLKIEGLVSLYSKKLQDTAFIYSKTFLIPSGVDSDKIEAVLENGVLTLKIPKEEKQKPRQIFLKSS